MDININLNVDATPAAQTFADTLVKFAVTFAGNQLGPVSISSVSNVEDKSAKESKATTATVENDEPVETPKENVAKRTEYWKHDGSGDIVKVLKGESLDFLDDDIFDRSTKAAFDAQEKAAKEAAEKPAEPAKKIAATDLYFESAVTGEVIKIEKGSDWTEIFNEMDNYEPASMSDYVAQQKTDEPAPAVARTLEEVRSKMTALSQAARQAEAKEILSEMGVKKLSELKGEQLTKAYDKAAALLGE